MKPVAVPKRLTGGSLLCLLLILTGERQERGEIMAAL